VGAVPHLPSPLRRPLSRFAALALALAAAPAVLADSAIDQCRALRRQGDLAALRDQQALLQADLPPEPDAAAAQVAAEALLACGAPQAALAVLERSGPVPDEARQSRLLLQWRAAHAGLHHAQAVEALALLAEGDLSRLETLLLPVQEPSRSGQSPRQQVALDLLADHLVSLEAHRQAAEVLLASRTAGVATAARWGRAVLLASDLPLQQRDVILEQALNQAAAAEAWGLVAALLDQQLADGVSDEASRRALERRLRLSERIDDAYGEWLQRRGLQDAAQDPRLLLLEGQLRSPRQDGGHAAPQLPSSDIPPP
jgi:hypothetical protein